MIRQQGRLPLRSQCRHDARGAQSAYGRRLPGRSRGGCREWRCRGRRGRGLGFRLFRPHRLAGRLRRRTGRLEFAYHRIGVDRCRCGGREIPGNIDHLDRHRQRLESVQRVGHGKVLGGYGNRTRRLATRSERGPGIGARRDGIDLDGNGRRRRFERERISGERRTTSQTEPCHGNHDDTTHDPSVTLLRPTATTPSDHRSVQTPTQPRGAESLTDG